MKIREAAIPYMVREIDYTALAAEIREVFSDEFGEENITDIKVAHFNPDMIDITIFVKQRLPSMDRAALALSELFGRQGIRVAIWVTND